MTNNNAECRNRRRFSLVLCPGGYERNAYNMTEEEKLQLIENTLKIEANTLPADSLLESLPQWDSLNILNLQIELTAIRPDITFDALRECKTIGDVCAMM